MIKPLERKYSEVISIRLTRSEKKEFDLLVSNLQTNKSEFIRKKIRRILKSTTLNNTEA